MNKILKKQLALLCAAALLLSGCAKQSAVAERTPTEAAPKILRVASGASRVNSSLDVADNTTYNYFGLPAMGIGECLFRLDDSLTAQPWLATGMTQVDELTWELTLRTDVKYHNGATMTAQTVKHALERTLRDFDLAAQSLQLTGLTAVDAKTLRLTTATPTPGLMSILADTLFMIYDFADGCDFATESYYTGPFVSGEIIPDVSRTLLRFDDYWGGPAKLAQIVHIATDNPTAALEAGDVDFAASIPVSDVAYFEALDGFTVSRAMVPRGEQLWFNESHPGVSDLAVRTAIAMCLDRAAIAQTLYGGMAAPAYGMFPALLSFGGTDGLNPTVDAFDPAGAQKILLDAGYADTDGDGILEKNGAALSFKVVAFSDQSLLAVADLLTSQLREIGIELTTEATYDTRSYEIADDFDILLTTYGMAMIGNPYYWMNTMVASDASANSGHYSNRAVDALIAQMNTAADTQTRDALCREIQQKLLDDCHWVVFAHKYIYYVHADSVTDFTASPCQYYTFDNQIDLA